MADQDERLFVSRDLSDRQSLRVRLTRDATDEDCYEVIRRGNIVRLSVESPKITDSGFIALCAAGAVIDLSVQDLQNVTNDGAEAVRRLHSLQRFTSNGWTRGSLIGGLSQLPGLEFCCIQTAALTDDAIGPLAGIGSLRNLYLDENAISGTSLCRFVVCEKLCDLTLVRNPVTAAGVECIGQLKGLTRLALAGCALRELSLSPLAQLKHLGRLHLEGALIAPSHFSDLERCEGLRSLWLSGECLAQREIDALAQLMQLEEVMICGPASATLLRAVRKSFRANGSRCVVGP